MFGAVDAAVAAAVVGWMVSRYDPGNRWEDTTPAELIGRVDVIPVAPMRPPEKDATEPYDGVVVPTGIAEDSGAAAVAGAAEAAKRAACAVTPEAAADTGGVRWGTAGAEEEGAAAPYGAAAGAAAEVDGDGPDCAGAEDGALASGVPTGCV